MTFDLDRLNAIGKTLGEAAIDPGRWSLLMEEIAQAVGAEGAALLQGDVRTADIPVTAGVADYFKYYFRNGHHVNDVRAIRGVPLLLAGASVIVDSDLFSSEREMLRDPLYAGLNSHKLRWFAGVRVNAGSELWGLTIQRTARQGMFDEQTVKALTDLSSRLSETASLSKAVSGLALSGITDALNFVRQPAIAFDHYGNTINVNDLAARILDDEIRIRDRRLVVQDKRAEAQLAAVADRLRNAPDASPVPADPIVIRRRARRPVVIRVLPVCGAARSPFLGARALLLLTDLEQRAQPDLKALASAFELTPAEARLAALMAAGLSPDAAAVQLGIAVETARNHLKAVFAKTHTHRQSELAALLSRL